MMSGMGSVSVKSRWVRTLLGLEENLLWCPLAIWDVLEEVFSPAGDSPCHRGTGGRPCPGGSRALHGAQDRAGSAAELVSTELAARSTWY